MNLDLSPANILIDPKTLRPTIIDYGSSANLVKGVDTFTEEEANIITKRILKDGLKFEEPSSQIRREIATINQVERTQNVQERTAAIAKVAKADRAEPTINLELSRREERNKIVKYTMADQQKRALLQMRSGRKHSKKSYMGGG